MEEPTIVKLNKNQVAVLDLREESYLVSWLAQVPDEEVFSHLRDFYGRLKNDFGDDYQKIIKAMPDSLCVFDISKKGIFAPLEDFIEPGKMKAHINDVDAAFLRINTPYVDIVYKFPITLPNSSYGHLTIASHLNLSQQLPTLMQQTQTGLIPQESLPELAKGLELALSNYN